MSESVGEGVAVAVGVLVSSAEPKVPLAAGADAGDRANEGLAELALPVGLKGDVLSALETTQAPWFERALLSRYPENL